MAVASEKIQQALADARYVLAITHVDPDGDALGSLTAVGLAMQQLGKNVTLACDHRSPARFDYLPLIDDIRTSPQTNKQFDLMIAVDCGDEQRMGEVFAGLPEPRPFCINIDHHVTNTHFGDVNLVDAEATSTTEILFDLFARLGVNVTPDIAMSLLTGLVTDTLGFRTVGVSPRTLKIAGMLMDAGADLSLITLRGLNLKPITTLKLWRIGLNNMKLEDGLIWSSINNEERAAAGYTSASTGGLVNLLADVDQAAMSAVLLEMEDGAIRVGFRCRPPYSVSELAINLGGGGHPLAAGCTLEGPLAQAEALVVKMSKETIRQQEVILRNGRR